MARRLLYLLSKMQKIKGDKQMTNKKEKLEESKYLVGLIIALTSFVSGTMLISTIGIITGS
jgi:hypothetical protein